MTTKLLKSIFITTLFFCTTSIFAQISTNFTFGFSFSDPNSSSYTYKIYVRAVGSNWQSIWKTEPDVTVSPSPVVPTNNGSGSVNLTTYGDIDDLDYCRFEILILRNDDKYISAISGWYSWNNPIAISTINLGSF